MIKANKINQIEQDLRQVNQDIIAVKVYTEQILTITSQTQDIFKIETLAKMITEKLKGYE